jgi:YD repeat-containing protein
VASTELREAACGSPFVFSDWRLLVDPLEKRKSFWRPPLWKWGLFLLLIGCSVGLFLWKPRVKVELLPFNDSPPAWDGSQPWLVISPISGSRPVRFKTSISPVKPTVQHDSPVNEFVVNLRNGNFKLRQTDIFVSDVMPLSLTRTYFAWNLSSWAFGVGTSHPYDICPTGTRFPYTYMELNLEDGYKVYMPRVSKGTGYADAVFRHDRSSSEFYGAQVAWNGNGWTLTFRDGRKIYFPEAYHATNFAQGAATEMVDAQGHRIQLKRDNVRDLEELISPSGHTIKFKYDSRDRIVEAQDDGGHIREYAYDRSGHLDTVSDGSQVLYRFEYQRLLNDAGYDPWLLTAVLDGEWKVLLKNKFLAGQVSEQRLADGEVYRYEYRMEGRQVVQTTVVLPSGEKKEFFFRDGILIEEK